MNFYLILSNMVLCMYIADHYYHSVTNVKRVYKFSTKHRASVEAGYTCACFHCERVFPPNAIKDWVDDGETALCPYCRIDAVVPGHHVINYRLIERMRNKYFGKDICK